MTLTIPSFIFHSFLDDIRQALTDSHCREIGDYDALVIVQLAGFQDGELLLYERLQMVPMLLERYAEEGSEKSRRQMLAMSQSEPEVGRDHVDCELSDKAPRLIFALFVFLDSGRCFRPFCRSCQ